MNRWVRSLIIWSLAIAGVAGFGLITSCNIIGGSSGGTGNLKLLMTDGPTDDWTEVTVHFLSASLHRQGSDTWEAFWTANTADPASGKVNLVDLSGVTDILQAAPTKAGTYDRLKLVIEHEHAAGLDEPRHRRRHGHQAGGHHGRRPERRRRDQDRVSTRTSSSRRTRTTSCRHRLRPGPSAVDRQPGRQGRHQPEGPPQDPAAQPQRASSSPGPSATSPRPRRTPTARPPSPSRRSRAPWSSSRQRQHDLHRRHLRDAAAGTSTGSKPWPGPGPPSSPPT